MKKIWSLAPIRFAPAISHFGWEGTVQSEEEHPVLFKAALENADAARDRLAELHSYDVPAILVWTAKPMRPLPDGLTNKSHERHIGYYFTRSEKRYFA